MYLPSHYWLFCMHINGPRAFDRFSAGNSRAVPRIRLQDYFRIISNFLLYLILYYILLPIIIHAIKYVIPKIFYLREYYRYVMNIYALRYIIALEIYAIHVNTLLYKKDYFYYYYFYISYTSLNCVYNFVHLSLCNRSFL